MASENNNATSSQGTGGHNEESTQQQQQQLQQLPEELEKGLLQEDQENDRDKIIAELTRANGILKANISTLYRTARAEIARKNDRIAELQSNLDDLLFKRMNRAGQSGNLANTSGQLLFTAGPSSIETKGST